MNHKNSKSKNREENNQNLKALLKEMLLLDETLTNKNIEFFSNAARQIQKSEVDESALEIPKKTRELFTHLDGAPGENGYLSLINTNINHENESNYFVDSNKQKIAAQSKNPQTIEIYQIAGTSRSIQLQRQKNGNVINVFAFENGKATKKLDGFQIEIENKSFEITNGRSVIESAEPVLRFIFIDRDKNKIKLIQIL